MQKLYEEATPDTRLDKQLGEIDKLNRDFQKDVDLCELEPEKSTTGYVEVDGTRYHPAFRPPGKQSRKKAMNAGWK